MQGNDNMRAPASAPRASRNFSFTQWCRDKGFTPKSGYDMMAAGLLTTFLIGNKRFVSQEEDARFDAATRSNTGVTPISHKPETFRKDRQGG